MTPVPAQPGRTTWLGAAVLAAALWLTPVFADTLQASAPTAQANAHTPQASYDHLPEAKALAVVPERPTATQGLTHSQPHDLAASFGALARCRQAALPHEHCEIQRLNDEHITSGAEIRARVPAGPHPLLLWRYQRGPVQVYLAGSIHVLKPSLYPLPAEYETAFRDSDHLVLEVDLTAVSAEEIQRRTQALSRLPASQTLREVLDPLLYQRLDQRLVAYGASADQMQHDVPAMAMNQLLIARLAALGYSAEYGLEAHFLRLRTDQAILELESLDSQLSLMFQQPLALQIELLEEALDTERDVEPVLADLLTAWLAGDDARLLELFDVEAGSTPALRAYQTALLDDRNEAMSEAILEFLAGPGGRYFVLVGSAHLVGEQGIVSLLARAGLHGERMTTAGP